MHSLAYTLLAWGIACIVIGGVGVWMDGRGKRLNEREG